MHNKKSSVLATNDASSSGVNAVIAESAELLQLREECLDVLTELRTNIANHNNLHNPETIVGINVLHGLADNMPATVGEMLAVVGITENWYQMWGEDFLEVLLLLLKRVPVEFR